MGARRVALQANPTILPARTPGGFSHVYKKARGAGWLSGPWRFLPGGAAVVLFHKEGDRICRGVAAPGPAPSSLHSWAAGCPFSRWAPPRHASERRPDSSARSFLPCRNVWHRPSSAAQPGGVGGQASVHTRPRRQDEVSSAGVSCPDPQTLNTRRLVLHVREMEKPGCHRQVDNDRFEKGSDTGHRGLRWNTGPNPRVQGRAV